MNTTHRHRHRRSAALAAIAALALAGTLTACGSSTPEGTVRPAGAASSSTGDLGTGLESASPSGTSTSGSDDTLEDSRVLSGVTVSAADAAQRALEKVPGSRVFSIDLDREHGTVVWEVDVATGSELREVHVDVATGAVLGVRTDHDGHDHARDVSRLDAAKLTVTDAITAAKGEVPGARVVEIELDEERGAIVWEVDLIAAGPTKHELTIDAATGAVTRGHH